MAPRSCIRKNWCRLPTCYTSSDLYPDLKFYSFPISRVTQLKWLDAVGIPEWRSFPSDKLMRLQLCSLHFDETCVSAFRHLYPTAVPSLHLFPDSNHSSSEEESVPCPPKKNKEMPVEETARCANCGLLLCSGKRTSSESRRQESKGIQIVGRDSSAAQTGLDSAKQPEVLDLTVPDLLNSVLKLPSPNPLTKDLRICVDCVPVLAKILALFNLLQKMSDANSALTTVFKDLEQMHLLVLDNRASQREYLQNQKEIRDKEKQSSSTKPRPVVRPPATASAFPEFETPVIIKTESISVMPGFSRQFEPPSPDTTHSDSEELLEPMEDPLAFGDGPSLAPDHQDDVSRSTNEKREMSMAKLNFFRQTKKWRQLAQQRLRKLLERDLPPGEVGRRRRFAKQKIYTHPPCPHCGRVLKSRFDRNALDRHIRLKHTYDTKFACDICGRPFPSAKSVRKHKLTHMNEEERSNSESQPSLCPECGKMLKGEECLRKHLQTHEDVESRLLRCPEQNCNYTTLTVSVLKRHAQLHDPTAEARFKCDNCGEAFKTMRHLKYHSMKDCAPPDRIHVCDLPGCGKRFKLKQQLVLHYVSRFHGLSAEEAREKVYPGLPCPDWVETQNKRKLNPKYRS